MSNTVLGLRKKQQLTLTPRLQQSVKLLQLSALECVQELHQAIAQNPFLEEAGEADGEGSDGSGRKRAASWISRARAAAAPATMPRTGPSGPPRRRRCAIRCTSSCCCSGSPSAT